MCEGRTYDDSVESTLDETFAAFADAERRFVVRYLDRHGATSLATMADQLAAERTDTAPTSVTATQRHEAEIRLHHVHLPKLTAAALVERSEGDDLVEPSDRLSSVLATLPVDATPGDWTASDGSALLD